MKSLDKKLKSIRAGKYSASEFVIADAKDGDMAFGVTAPGPDRDGRWKSREQHLSSIEEMCKSQLVDIMLMSASSAEILNDRGILTNLLSPPLCG